MPHLRFPRLTLPSLRCGALLALLLLTAPFLSAQSEATFYTNMGTFVAKLYDTIQPITAGNFISLVNQKFYDGIIFHRVVAGFVVQGGDPTGTGSGGPGYTIQDEFDPRARNVVKSLGMANSGPNTGGSQFYINLVNNTFLDPNYPVFGIVTYNFSVVQAIGQVAVDANDRPLTPVVMDSVRITYAFVPVSDEPEVSAQDQITVFPNPLSGESVLRIRTTGNGDALISLHDLQGRELSHSNRQLHSGEQVFRLHELFPVSLPAGTYFIRIEQDGTRSEAKVMVH